MTKILQVITGAKSAPGYTDITNLPTGRKDLKIVFLGVSSYY